MKISAGSFLIMSAVTLSMADIAVTTNARTNLQVTIYRDFGIVKDTRTVNLLQGANRIRFEDVATRIQESTAEFTWNGKSPLEILGQTYEFDLMSPVKLLEKYIGKELEIVPSNGNFLDTIPQKAELISIHEDQPVFRVGTKITFGQIGRILFPYVPENLYTKPTLITDVVSQERQDIELIAEYATDSISWNAVYYFSANTKDATGKLGGWIQFDNRSGFVCKDAAVTFVAGYAHQVRNEQQSQNFNNQRKKAGDFYFYSINHPITLMDNQKKQIEWIPEVKIKYQPGYCAEFYDTGAVSEGEVYTVAQIENKQENNLGLPLPGGIVRVSKSDVQQNDWFVGEDLIDDIKSNSSFELKINAITDIVATRKKINEQGNGCNFIIEIKNNKEKECTVTVREPKLHGSSIVSNDKFSLDGSTVIWKVRVPAGQSSKVSYSLQKKG